MAKNHTPVVSRKASAAKQNYKFLGADDVQKRKMLIDAASVPPGSFDDAMRTTEEAVQVRIIFKPTATVDEIMALFQNSNFLALANSGQNGQPAPSQGGPIQIFSTVGTPVRIVDCPTLLTHVKFSLELPDVVGSFRARSVKRSTLLPNGGGYQYVDQGANPTKSRDAIVEVGTFAHLASQYLFRAISFLFGLGCEYTVFNHPLTVTGLARHNNLRGTGCSTSAGTVISALEEANRNALEAGDDEYVIQSTASESCGDSSCCEPCVLQPTDLMPINFVETYFPGDLNGMVPLPFPLMVDTSDAISCEAIITDEASLRRFAELISSEAHELVEGAGTNITKTVFNVHVQSFGQGVADTLRVGVNPCFDPDASSNPADSYVDITTTTDYVPCEGIATVFDADDEAKGVWRYGAQSLLNGSVIANSGVDAGQQLSTGPTGVTMAQPRETLLSCGPALPKVVKVGNLALVITLLGRKLTAYSWAAAKWLEVSVNGAPELGIAPPAGLDKKTLLEAYSRMSTKFGSKLLTQLSLPKDHAKYNFGVAGLFQD